MEFKSIRNDFDVKPIWRNGMSILWYGTILLFIVRVLIRMKDRANGIYSETQSFLNYILLVGFGIYLVIAFIYLVKPGLFKKSNIKQRIDNYDKA